MLRKPLFYLTLLTFTFFGSAAYFLSTQSTTAPHFKYVTGHLSVINSAPPADLTFCDTPVPLDKPHVKSLLEREIARQLEGYNGTLLTFQRANRYQDEFLSIMNEMGVPEDFFYLVIAESNLSNASSPAGAQGFWQFMHAAATMYGLEISETVDERYHPEKSTVAACRYLKNAYEDFGDWALVAASYNMGNGGLSQAIKAQGTRDYYDLKLNRETGHYLYRILAYKSIMEAPERYGIAVSNRQLFQPIPYRAIKVQENIPDLASFAQQHGTDYATLKLLNPWLIASRLDITPGKTYEIRLPAGNYMHASELRVQRPASADSMAAPVEPQPQTLLSSIPEA
ncbi:MAG: lytic transglycosylase domain-containing protein [Bacteroidia bacterium]|nr:lytic transglycosylase domain-containing protein [Bacteroidia bacterium]